MVSRRYCRFGYVALGMPLWVCDFRVCCFRGLLRERGGAKGGGRKGGAKGLMGERADGLAF